MLNWITWKYNCLQTNDYYQIRIFTLIHIIAQKLILLSKFYLVVFYSISTVVGYWMPVPVYTYVISIYDL